MNMLYFRTVLTMCLISLTTSQMVGRQCRDEENCELIHSCPFALALIDKIDRGNRKVLKEMLCGFEGDKVQVCCPKGNPIIFREESTLETQKPTQTDTPAPSTPNTQRSSNTEPYKFETVLTTLPTQRRPPARTVPVFESTTPIYVNEASNAFAVTDVERQVPSLLDRNTFPDNVEKYLPSRKQCGIVREENRIFGGTIAAIDEFPWIARIKLEGIDQNSDKSMYGCGGSLINDRFVLTAAHCAVARQFKITEVRLGEWDTETERDCSEEICNNGPVDVKVDKVIIYPDYNRAKLYDGDIALLQLEHPVKFNDFIQPICLPTTEYIARQDYVPETLYSTAGWGITEYDIPSAVKRKLELKVVDPEICLTAYNLNKRTLNESSILCAGGRKNEDTCRGDSGGPLVKKVAENYQTNWFLYGIVSFGSNQCGAEGKPGLYVRVSKYMDWIVENIR